ncbi:unnamed protein product [Hermetia illucens]|uniref:DUF7041 domain-containing protein n=1 Tax=Hermetia illucens TaxID=343691 RepID=A0A7R8UJM8_HERIL|nr:unnamed protein product [Hermetia illucens]
MPERHQQSLQSARYSTRIVLPQFIPREPQVWFAVSEQVFQTHKIICESERYNIAVAALDPKHALEVKDIILKPPAEKPYTAFKEALIARLGSSQEQQLRQLLEREAIGDRKPSQFLRHLQHLAGSAVGDDFVRTLWMSRMPASMQGILTTQKNESLVKQAELADAIGDATSSAQLKWPHSTLKLTGRTCRATERIGRAGQDSAPAPVLVHVHGQSYQVSGIATPSEKVQKTLRLRGKRERTSLMAASDPSTSSCRLFISDDYARLKPAYIFAEGSGDQGFALNLPATVQPTVEQPQAPPPAIDETPPQGQDQQRNPVNDDLPNEPRCSGRRVRFVGRYQAGYS